MKNQAKQDKSKIPAARLIFFNGNQSFQKKLKIKIFKNCVMKWKGEKMATLRLIFEN